MQHRSLWLFQRRDGVDTLHWFRNCRIARQGDFARVIELGWDWQEEERLTDAPPSRVVERALELFSARVCVHCFPQAVLERLGLEKPENVEAKRTTGMSLKEIALHTDGSCSGNPGPGGWGAILVYGKTKRELSGGEAQTTNNQMELQAVIEGLRALKEPCRVSVYSDSKYVVKALNDDWVSRWVSGGWLNAQRKPVANRKLWEQLLDEVQRHDVRWSWVEGHSGEAHNERCHALAVAAAARQAHVDSPNRERSGS